MGIGSKALFSKLITLGTPDRNGLPHEVTVLEQRISIEANTCPKAAASSLSGIVKERKKRAGVNDALRHAGSMRGQQSGLGTDPNPAAKTVKAEAYK